MCLAWVLALASAVKEDVTVRVFGGQTSWIRRRNAVTVPTTHTKERETKERCCVELQQEQEAGTLLVTTDRRRQRT